MTEEQVRALVNFLTGLNELAARTGVEIHHYDQVSLRFADGQEVDLALSATRGEGYRLERPHSS